MAWFRDFVLPPNGSITLSPLEIAQLASHLCDALTENRPVSIGVTSPDSLRTPLRHPVLLTMSVALHSTSSPRHRCCQMLEGLWKPPAESGGVDTTIRSTSEYGKGE